MADRALANLLASQGEKHRVTADAFGRSAVPRRKLGHIQEALALQRKAVAAYEASIGPKHFETTKALLGLCDLLIANSLHQEAPPLCARAEATIRGAPRGYESQLPIAQLLLAQAQLALGHRSTADSLVSEARRGMGKGLGSRWSERLLAQITTAAATRQ
jgi:hypothetical protein